MVNSARSFTASYCCRWFKQPFISFFEASLRATLARLNTTLQISSVLVNVSQANASGVDVTGSEELSKAGSTRLDMAALRLTDAPEKARRL